MTLLPPSEECMALIYKEFGSTQDRVDLDVQVLKKWLHQQPHLPHVEDDRFIRNMFVRCKCSAERTKRALDMHFTLKTALPEFFADRDPLSDGLQSIMNLIYIAPLPRTTAGGSRVIVLKNQNKDPTDFKVDAFIAHLLMQADIRFIEDQSVADIYIYDFEHIGLGHVSRLSLPLLKKMETVASEGYRARIQSVHFVNAPPVVDVLLTMVKAVIKSKLAQRHYVHANLESLYKHVDRDILPVEYGGTSQSLSEHAREWREKLVSHRDWFLEQEETSRADESKRLGKSFNSCEYFGFEGTFKQLSVD